MLLHKFRAYRRYPGSESGFEVDLVLVVRIPNSEFFSWSQGPGFHVWLFTTGSDPGFRQDQGPVSGFRIHFSIRAQRSRVPGVLIPYIWTFQSGFRILISNLLISVQASTPRVSPVGNCLLWTSLAVWPGYCYAWPGCARWPHCSVGSSACISPSSRNFMKNFESARFPLNKFQV